MVYFSFMEIGVTILSMEDAWFCLAAERSAAVKRLKGGIAQVIGGMLRSTFVSGPHTLHQSGVVLHLADGTSTRLFAKLEMLLQDGDAHKRVFMMKGDSGHKFCMGCRNLYSVSSEITNDDGDDFFTCSLIYEEELDFATDDDVRGTVRRLAEYAATCSSEELRLREQAAGFSNNPANLLLDPALDAILQPVTHFAHDWMHALVVHGVWNTIMFRMLKALVDSGVAKAPEDLCDYVALWTVPLRLGGAGASERLADTFSKSRWKSAKNAKYMKATASDALSLYNIVACYIFAVFMRANRCVPECTAYLFLADVLDMLVASPRGNVTPAMLRAAIKKFLESCVRAGWRIFMHPKFHWLIHLYRELAHFKMLLSCWVHERKHKMVKRYSNDVRNTTSFEKTILSEVTCHHLAELECESKFDLSVRLISPVRAAGPKLISFLASAFSIEGDNVVYTTSARARVSEFEVCRRQDVVLFLDPCTLKVQCGEVCFFAACNDCAVALISLWHFETSEVEQGTVTVRIADDTVELFSASDILVSCTYRRKADGRAQIIVPSSYRGRVG